MIKDFSGEYSFLSNFYQCYVRYKGVTYQCSEAAYQAQKFTHLTSNDLSLATKRMYGLSDNDTLDHMFCMMDGKEAKKMSRKLPIRPDWEFVKYNIMLNIVRAKFDPHQDVLVKKSDDKTSTMILKTSSLTKKLLSTGDEEIIEENYWHDNEWGACTCEKCKDIPKKNMLGKILMTVREELRKNKEGEIPPVSTIDFRSVAAMCDEARRESLKRCLKIANEIENLCDILTPNDKQNWYFYDDFRNLKTETHNCIEEMDEEYCVDTVNDLVTEFKDLCEDANINIIE